MTKKTTKYAICRNDNWLDARGGWTCLESERGLWNSKKGAMERLNRTDRIGFEPQDPFAVALKCNDTYLVAVHVYTEIENGGKVPIRVKMKDFKHRWSHGPGSYHSEHDGQGNKMAQYFTDEVPE
jgi:hypothetical protein